MEIKNGDKYWLVGYKAPEGSRVHNGHFSPAMEYVVKMFGSDVELQPTDKKFRTCELVFYKNTINVRRFI